MFIVLAILVTLGLLYYLFPPVLIVGNSMYPTYKDGDIVLSTRLFNKRTAAPGEVYVVKVRWEKTRKYVKRLKCHSQATREIFITGDNIAESYDSRDFGWIRDQCLVTKVIYPRKTLL